MKKLWTLALALLARILSAISGGLADWLLERLLEGAEIGWDWLREAYEFAEWLVEMLAHRLYHSQGGEMYVQ